MSDKQTLIQKLQKVRSALKHGERRELARRCECHPNTITNVFDGFSSDTDLMSRILNAASDLITERDGVVPV